MYYDADCSKELLKNLTVAVIGYGSQGHAHAQVPPLPELTGLKSSIPPMPSKKPTG